SVVADRLRSVHSSPQIVLGDFADRALRILRRVPEPDAGVTAPLQLEPNRWRTGPAPLPALHPAHGTGQVLDVMAELVGEYVRLGGVAALPPGLPRQLTEKSNTR